MDDFKPESDTKADRNDRRASRSCQSPERDTDPRINSDDVDLGADEGRPTRAGKAHREREEEEFKEEPDAEDEELLKEQPVERRPRKCKKAPTKLASRQYIMMGAGILVLLLLIVGIGSALRSPSSSSQQTASGEKSINLSDDQSTSTSAAGQDQTTAANITPQQDVTVPPIATNPMQGQAVSESQGQQRIEVQGNLNNAPTQQQGQLDGAVASSTLPTEPATIAPIHNGANNIAVPRQATERQTVATPRPTERKYTVIEAKPQTKPQAVVKVPVETKPAQPRHAESAVTTAPAKTIITESKPVAIAQSKPVATTSTTAAVPVAMAAPAAKSGKTAGDVSSMKSAPSGNYTLQPSSFSNYGNLDNWAKREKLDRYTVHETSRNSRPWYALVSGIHTSKEEAKRAATLPPADVQAKNPWAKPLYQVQVDLKQCRGVVLSAGCCRSSLHSRRTCNQLDSMKRNRVFLEWAGEKYPLLDDTKKRLPEGEYLVELFVGAGSVLLNIGFSRYILADVSSDLIGLYNIVKLRTDEYVAAAREVFVPENNVAERYYQYRDEFNQSQGPLRHAVLFPYLNRHGYNDLCRYNLHGEFNVPFGRYRKPYFSEAEPYHFAEKAQNAEFYCESYEEYMQRADSRTVVYCDPPYASLTATVNFIAYHTNSSNLEQQVLLAQKAESLMKRRIPVLISNHRIPLTQEWYKNATEAHIVKVRRNISSNDGTRKKVDELLALYRPPKTK